MNYCLGILYWEYEVGFMHNYFSPIIKYFRDTAERAGYSVRFLTRKIGNRDISYLDYCREVGIDGVAVISCDFYDPDVEELVRSDIPCVTIDHVFHGHTCVMSGNRQGVFEMMRHVLDMGHKRIAFISGTYDDVTRIRQACILRALADAGLSVGDEYLLHESYHNPEAAYSAAKRLMALPEPPTCILMPDDVSAIGGMKALEEMGLKPGKDISVVGFDGVKMLNLFPPILTTVAQNTEIMGATTAQKLIERIEKPAFYEPEIISVPCTYIEGETLCPPKGQ